MANNSPSGIGAIVNGPLTNKDGTASPGARQLFRDWNTRLTNGLNLIGDFIGNLSQTTGITGRGGDVGTILNNISDVGNLQPAIGVTGRGADVGTILGNIDDTGVVTGPGADFSRPYVNKNTDNIADGSGNPLAGGKVAHQALVVSPPPPVASQWVNAFDPGTGLFTQSQPTVTDVSGLQLPLNAPSVGSEWLNSYDSATGVFTQSQPAFTDISGTAVAAQVPALSALSGAITAGQLPANVPVVSFGTGAPSSSSTEGYIYFDTTGSPFHGYVYHSGAWGQFS